MQEYHLFFCSCCGNISPLDNLDDDLPACPFCHSKMMYLFEDIPLQEYLKKGIYWSTIRKLIQQNINKNDEDFNQQLFDKRAERDRILEENYTPLMQSFQEAVPEASEYVPRCPTCGSPNVFNRGNGAGKTVYGLMVHKQYVCNNCGYEW